ncbi:MAG TPA: alpha/beta hydrolase [Noviherbaspirillum sp.]|nr:alpha/beta hydrolase [Noviherbaspirillum sp.]
MKRTSSLLIPLILLAGCGGNNDPVTPIEAGTTETSAAPAASASAMSVAETPRLHDAKTFSVDPGHLPFGPMPGVAAETDRWHGVLNGAGYRVEVPKNWNGRLVLYAHGYEGQDAVLRVSDIPIRRHLVENGYAWAASSFSRNGYDVRTGIEDTNALALAFTAIAAQNQRPLPAPSRIYIVGASMGGHVAAAAVEREALESANNKVRYHGAMPMCGVVGDTELFNYITAYQLAAQYLAGIPATSFPVTDFASKEDKIKRELWRIFPAIATSQGRKLRAAFINLTGGPRPIADISFRLKPLQDPIWRRFGHDGTLEGIVSGNVADTTGIVYQLDEDPAQSAEEQAMNVTILRVAADPQANPRRSDGLRWIPTVNGQFDVPVVTLQTLGDLVVPFSMQQVYKRRAIANGSDRWLVQRAIRGPGHCDFTIAEQVEAFEAMVNWDLTGVKPMGDEVLDPATVAGANYGCAFTRNNTGPDDQDGLDLLRKLMPSCP